MTYLYFLSRLIFVWAVSATMLSAQTDIPEKTASATSTDPVTPPSQPKVPGSVAPTDSTIVKPVEATREPEILVSTLEPSELKEWDKNSLEIKSLLQNALDLTKQKLKYSYGSADPKKGGMDCSGTIYYLLKQAGLKEPPRQANLFYVWVRQAGLFRAVVSTSNESFELDELKPGDLLLWTGTYSIERDPPVTHVMIYLGRRKSDNRRVMMGASEGRRYDGKSRYGVSVFDFRLPGFPPPKGYKDDGGRFIGYGRIPNLPAIEPPPEKLQPASTSPLEQNLTTTTNGLPVTPIPANTDSTNSTGLSR